MGHYVVVTGYSLSHPALSGSSANTDTKQAAVDPDNPLSHPTLSGSSANLIEVCNYKAPKQFAYMLSHPAVPGSSANEAAMVGIYLPGFQLSHPTLSGSSVNGVEA